MTAISTNVTAAEAIAQFSGAIVTRRTVLRPVVLSDAEGLFAHYNNFDVMRWLARPSWPPSLERLQDYIVRSMDAKTSGTMVYCVIHVEGVPAGGITWDTNEYGSHIGYWIGQAHWGMGYMSEAAVAFCDAIFGLSGETAIHSGAFDGNSASLRVQRKLGFVETGRSVHHCTPRGVDLTHIDTKLTRTARRVVLEKARS